MEGRQKTLKSQGKNAHCQNIRAKRDNYRVL